MTKKKKEKKGPLPLRGKEGGGESRGRGGQTQTPN